MKHLTAISLCLITLCIAPSVKAFNFNQIVEYSLDEAYSVDRVATWKRDANETVQLQNSFTLSSGGTATWVSPDSTIFEQSKLSLFGRYSFTDNSGVSTDGGVIVFMRRAAAIELIGNPFSTVFEAHTESQVASWLDTLADPLSSGTAQNEATAGLTAFGAAYENLLPAPGEFGSFVAFSNAQIVGEGQWSNEPVPEPASIIALSAGVAGLLRKRKKA